jgi:brefeldin A-resistance guanine nucleotide exchange factor 1
VGGGSGGGGGDEPPLTVGFFMLKDLLEAVRDLRDVNPLDIIQPFVQVVLSADTTGPITSAALLSLEKLVSHGVIGKSLTLLTK